MKLTTTIAILSAATFVQAKILNVITTTQDLAAIAAAVGGDKAKASALVLGARDPHRIDPKPSYMSRLGSADLFIAIGLDMEIGYEDALVQGSRNSRIQRGAPGNMHAGDYVPVLQKPTGEVNRSMGDLHPYGNPHIWLDPYNGRILATKIAEKMAGLNPSDATTYRANAKTFIDKLDDKMFGKALVDKYGPEKLWTWIRNKELLKTLREQGTIGMVGGWVGKMAPYVGTNVLTYHRSWTYFINRFGLESSGELEPKPGIDPTPSHLAKMIEKAKADNVRLILQEPLYSTRNAEFVAARTKAVVVVAPGNVGHTADAKDYFSLFDSIIDRIAAALK